MPRASDRIIKHLRHTPLPTLGICRVSGPSAARAKSALVRTVGCQASRSIRARIFRNSVGVKSPQTRLSPQTRSVPESAVPPWNSPGALLRQPAPGTCHHRRTQAIDAALYPFRHVRQRGALEAGQGRIEKWELTRFRTGCQRRATTRCHPSRRVHRRDGERHGVACDILQRRRGALPHVTAGGDGAAKGGRDSGRFTERRAPPRKRRSPRSGRSTGSREPGPPALHGE